uniref:Uncharacterized protein n=1 Tax=Prymnesium polylepis TaxID=72548 RepID=A0A7S4MXK3_9EUKA
MLRCRVPSQIVPAHTRPIAQNGGAHLSSHMQRAQLSRSASHISALPAQDTHTQLCPSKQPGNNTESTKSSERVHVVPLAQLWRDPKHTQRDARRQVPTPRSPPRVQSGARQ